MDSLLLDLRDARRAVLRHPFFSTLAILTLAIGIGVNAVAFSTVSALLFKPFSFDGVERLAWIMTSSRNNPYGETSWTDFQDLRGAASFEGVAAEARVPLAWRTGGASRQIWGLLVTSNYFALLGAHAEDGRTLSAADDHGALRVMVSHRFWRTYFGGTPPGERTITINGQSATIVGIAPDTFQGPGGLYEPDVWVPLERACELRLTGTARHANEPALTVIARLRDSVTAAQARAELDGIARTLKERARADDESRSIALYLMKDGHPEVRGMSPIVWLAMSVVGLVLLLACFNVASLLLARASERQREIGMRAALGASRWRIVRQLLTEGAVLSVLAGSAAVALAAWSGRLLAAFSVPAPIPQRLHMGVDARVVGFTLLMVLIATILPSLLPAWHATRRRALRTPDAWVIGGRGIRSGFVIAQIAGSTIFLAAALLFVRSFWNATSVESGFDDRHTVVAEIAPFLYGYDAARTGLLADAAMARLSALQGVRGVSLADRAPYHVGFGKSDVYSIAEDCSVTRCPAAAVYRVGSGHLRSLGITLREGRELSREDGESRVVVSARLARQLWPGRTAIGRVLRIGRHGQPVEVVGVAADAKLRNPSKKPAPVIYRPWRGEDARDGLSIIVRTSDDAARMLGTVRDALSSLDRGLPTQSLKTMRERMAVPLWPSRTLAGFFAVCGALSLVLATVGLFGVTYYVVQQRTREFGVRIALGAARERIVGGVLAEGVRVAFIGTLLGGAGAYVTARLLARALVDVSPADPLTYSATAVLQIAIALAACALPAWRASRADPMRALRAE